MCIFNCRADHAQNGRVIGIIKTVKPFHALPVNSKRVLCQVICADGEEIDFTRQLVGNHYRRGCFHHNPKRNPSGIRNFFACKLLADFGADTLDFLHFPNTGNHWEHNGKVSKCRSTVKCTQLSLKDFRPRKADADSAHSKGRVLFRCKAKVACLLVGANIQGADDDRLPFHSLKHSLISCKLLVFRWKIFFSEIKEFAAEKANPAGIAVEDGREITGICDVCIQPNRFAVKCCVRLAL